MPALPVEGDARGLYRDCYAQGGAYAGYLDLGGTGPLSASPELFFEVRDGAIATPADEGTKPRGRWPAEDRAVAEQLLASRKDRAENAMIVDLLGGTTSAGSPTPARSPGPNVPRRATSRSGSSSPLSVPSRHRPRRRVRRPVPERVGHGRPEGPHDGADRRARGLTPGRVLRRRRLPLPGGSDRPDARGSTSRYRNRGSNRHGDGRVRRRRGGITWDSDGAAEYDEAVAGPLLTERVDFELLETMRFDPGTGVLHLDLHLNRLAGWADYFGYVRPDRGGGGGREGRRRHATGAGDAGAAPLRKDGTDRVVATPLSDDP